MPSSDLNDQEGVSSPTNKNVLLIILCVTCILGGLMNNVGVQMMGNKMPPFASFLLYGTTLMYVLLFFSAEVISSAFNRYTIKEIIQRWSLYGSRKLQIVVLVLGVLTALNGVLAQSAIPFIEPQLAVILKQVALPVTWACYPLILKKKVEVGQIGSFFLISFGLLFGSIYGYIHGAGGQIVYTNSIFWIIVIILSAIPTSFEILYQEVAYDTMKAPIFIVLVYYNLFSLIIYFFWIFMTAVPQFGTCLPKDLSMPLSQCTFNMTTCTVPEAFIQQGEAFKCFFGVGEVQCCGSYASLWVMVFTLGYFISFISSSYLLERYGSNVWANLNALIFPLTTATFWIKPLVGDSASSFEWYVLVSIIAITLGNLTYEWFSRRPLYEFDLKFLPWYNYRYEVSGSKNENLLVPYEEDPEKKTLLE
ncbi:hypothetical protein AKO1_015130 [Acrasis kona]|uniref:Uncharacterized protein n=1 Tax=Acrasis kona TaxID=1008807 RepID=A0AAW2Z0S7_9EUKA